METCSSAQAVAVESAYATCESSAQNILQALQQINNRLGLMDNNLGNINNNLQIGLAHTSNLRVIRRNMQLQAPLQLHPLQKTVPGYGRNLALPFIAAMDQPGRQQFHNEYPGVPNHVDLIGTVPANFNPRVDSYHHIDICRLMVFYNETFGIIPQDDLPERRNKFRQFLTEF